jgi:hypothetical protein
MKITLTDILFSKSLILPLSDIADMAMTTTTFGLLLRRFARARRENFSPNCIAEEATAMLNGYPTKIGLVLARMAAKEWQVIAIPSRPEVSSSALPKRKGAGGTATITTAGR